MVPLISVFWQWGSPRVPEWLKQIEAILELLEVMEEWSLAARRSREVVWRMYEASRAIQAQNPHTNPQQRSESPSIHLRGDGMLMPENDMHMSPIGLEPVEGLGMMGLLDQHGLWDLDGMYWGGQSDEVDFTGQGVPFTAPGGPAMGHGVHDTMLHMDYGMNHVATAAAMEGFPYVH